jgi:hypothetical protein
MQQYDYLLDISSNTVCYLNPLRYEQYMFEHGEKEDYIVCLYQAKSNTSKGSKLTVDKFSSYEMVAEVLNIGRFIHLDILKLERFGILNDYINEVRFDEKYDTLICKILDFCSKYGNYKTGSPFMRTMEILSDFHENEESTSLKVNDFLKKRLIYICLQRVCLMTKILNIWA